jgi:cytochrome c oxidase subunit 2
MPFPRGQRPGKRWLAPAAVLLAVGLSGCAKQGADVNGQRVHSLYDVIFALALPVFVVVEALLLWYVLRYRKRDDRTPPQSFGTRRALIIFFLIPTIIVAADYAYGERTLAQVEKLDPNPQVVIRVEGFQWEWTFYYLNEGVFSTGKTLVKPALMVVPVDEPVKIELVSRDVIHSFFVPAFLFKRDVIPGRVNTFTFTANRLGTFPAQCAEFCGLWHSKMLFSVQVVNPGDYLAWIKQTREAILNVSCPAGSTNSLQVVAKNISWNTNCLAVHAGSQIGLTVVNQDDGIDHNFAIYNSVDRTTRFFQTGRFAGVATRSFTLQALPPGHYYFQCDVHGPAMSGVFIVK